MTELTQLNQRLREKLVERRRAEEALQQSHHSLSMLLDSLPGMVYRCRNDRVWTMEFVSEGCFGLTGYPPTDLIDNQKVTYGQLIHPADRDAVWDEVQARLKEKRPYQVIYRLRTAAGAEKWVWEQGRGSFSPEGKLVAVEGFVTDITERAQAYRRLETQVQVSSRELATLFEVQQAITRRLDPAEVLQLIADGAHRLTSASIGAVLLFEDNTGRIAALAGEYPGEIRLGDRLPAAGTALLAALTTGRPVNIADVHHDTRYNLEPARKAGLRALLLAPLLSELTPIGAIAVGHEQAGALGVEDIMTDKKFGVARAPQGFGLFKDHETDWTFKRTLEYMTEKCAEIR